MFANHFGKYKNICCGLVSIVEGQRNGNYPIPLTSVNVSASVIHAVALVEITQNYVNKEEQPIEAIYYFPVDPDGAVTNFQAELDGKLIKGTVKPREEAREAYGKAVANRTTSFLGEETKADIFNLRVGCLKPGARAKITIEYITEVKNEPGTNNIRFYVPTTIAPRYVSPSETDDQAMDVRKIKFSDSSPAPLSLNVRVSLQGGIKSITSPTHKVTVDITKPTRENYTWHKATVALSGHTTDMDRDFVLNIEPEERHKPRLYSERKSTDGSTAVMIHLLPSFKLDEQKTELIFVLDRSRSMMGQSIGLAKKALSLFLHSMPADCYFNVIGFGYSYECLFPTSVKYDDGSLKKAKAHADELQADLGGTEILKPLKKLYEEPAINGYLKQIFILTDGEVSNTKAVFGIVQANAHKVRVFALGIGDAASHDLVEGVAKAGGGTAAFATYNESIDKKVLNQLKNALQPSLTDIELEWEGLSSDDTVEQQPTPVLNKTKTLLGYNKPIDSDDLLTIPSFPKIRQSPKRIPPVYDGTQLLVFGLFRNDECPKSVLITAQSPDGPLTLRVEHFPSNHLDGGTEILHRLAAIKLIRELEIEATAFDMQGWEAETKLKNEIVEIACHNGVTSRYTSFVASDVKDDKESVDKWEMETRYVLTQKANRWHGGSAVQNDNGWHGDYAVQNDNGWHRNYAVENDNGWYRNYAVENDNGWHRNYAVENDNGWYRNYAVEERSVQIGRSWSDCYMQSNHFSSESSKSSRKCLSRLRSSYASISSTVRDFQIRRGIPTNQSSSHSLEPLMQLVSLQSYDGSFALNEALASILNKTLMEMKAASDKHNLATEVFATALALSFFVHNLPNEKDKWELIVVKARKWLTNAVQPENVDRIVKLAVDFLTN